VTQSDPRGMHDWHSPTYVQEWIGGYTSDERKRSLRRIPYLVPFDPGERIRVLDVGGGWGPVTTEVLEVFPNAEVVLHDFSEPMLREAASRLARFGDAVRYVRGDLLSAEWKDEIVGQFNAVVSSLAIHNVRFPDRIRAIYGEIFSLVAPGGCFINLDQVATGSLAANASRHAQQMERRQHLYDETGQWATLEEIGEQGGHGRPAHATAQPDPETLRRIAAAEPATLANQLRWLREVGFDDVDCFGRERTSALIGAFRAP